jgi:branched-chain amino acid transport system permease protein
MAGDATERTEGTEGADADRSARGTGTEATTEVAGLSLSLRHLFGLAGLAVLALAPLATTGITLLKLAGALFFAVFVMSWDVVSGYTGEISFGHALFFGTGGYTSGMLGLHLGVDPLLSIPLGALAAAIMGLLIGVPSLRLQGPYFALITLVTPVILLSVFRFFPGLTGGELGLVSVGSIATLTIDPLENYYLAFGLFVSTLAVFLAVTRSDIGNVLTAIREDEDTVAASGFNPAKFKVFAFVLSGAVGGFAGALFAHSAVGSATPSELLSLTVSIEVIVAAVLGGIGTISGAAVGGLFFFLLRDVLRNVETIVLPVPFDDLLSGVPATIEIDLLVPILDKPVAELYFLVFLLITLAFLFFLPEGIVARLVALGRRAQGRLSGDRNGPMADGGRVRERRDTGARASESPLERIVERYRTVLDELFGHDRRK